MEFNTVLHRRYSCRAFSPTPIEQEKVDRILEAGRIAPTAVNKQPVHLWAISDPGTLEAIKGVTRSNYGAPLILVVGCRPADAWVRRYDGKNGAEVDASIVATYLMLAAENEGLATLWVGSFRLPRTGKPAFDHARSKEGDGRFFDEDGLIHY